MADVENGPTEAAASNGSNVTYFSIETGEKRKTEREDADYAPEVSVNGLLKFWTSICRVELGPQTVLTAADKPEWGFFAPLAAWVDNTFRVTERGSTFFTEIVGGFTTFFTIAYILTVNPHLLEATGIPSHATFFSTALASGVFTNVMGIVTNLPIAVGPSLGLNVYFREIAETCPMNQSGTLQGIPCDSWGKTTLPWSDALGAVYISGWLYLALTVTGFRGYLVNTIPRSIRSAIAAGTGFFLAYQGLKIGSITRVSVQSNYAHYVVQTGNCGIPQYENSVCTDRVNLGQQWYNLGIAHFSEVPAARIAVLGIVFLSFLELFKVRGSYIIAIWLATLIGINYFRCTSTDQPGVYSQDCVTPLHIWGRDPAKIPFITDWSNNAAGELTFKYANTVFFWKVVWTFLFFEIFDSYGAIEGIVARMGLTNSHPTVSADRVNRAMFVDGVSVWIGSIMGVNSMNVYIESNTGVEAGARTGLASVVTGSLLLLCLLFVYPFVSIIPPCATTCALLMVGVYSLLEYKRIDFKDYIIRFTAFIIIAVMGFTFSITNGISAGLIFYCWLQILAVIFQKVGINVEEIRPGTKVALPNLFIILMAVFSACRFSYLGQN